MELAREFQAELVAAGGDVAAFEQAPTALQSRLDALIARGRAAHSELVVSDEAFVAQLARSAARSTAEGPALEDLAIEDLFLACACATGASGAAEAFDARCGARLKAAAGGATKSEDERREMEQRLRHLLLVGSADDPPRLAGYSGQGPLDRWVAVVAQRQIVTAIRSEQAERRAREGAAQETAALEVAVHPEVAFLKERYKSAFEQAMVAALAKLGERDRVLLKLHLVNGVAVAQIGQMYGVSQSTASRWLADARDAVSLEVTRYMRDHAGVNASEMSSLAGLVASQLNLSMSRLLK
ncbi:MAG: putative DNA-binding regulatory protein [Myxococcales bacterium]|nr:putative DNA-binding regulatory protein [Myxococcales bacterium]